jgi:hypothetical protein
MKFLIFVSFCFVGHFCPPGSGFRIRLQIRIKSGSGSETLEISCLYQYILCVGATLPLLLGYDHILVDLTVVYKHTVLLQSINQLQFIMNKKGREIRFTF